MQAAINAARTYLPANLPSNPSYRKVNPADAPIMILSLTSDKYPVTKLYDLASTILEQKLSQIQGVGQVGVQGGATPSVRVEINPTKLESFGLTLGNVQSVLSLQNSHEPRGQLSDNGVTEDILTNDQISQAADYRPLIVGYHNGEAVRLSDVADVVDSTHPKARSSARSGFLPRKMSCGARCRCRFAGLRRPRDSATALGRRYKVTAKDWLIERFLVRANSP